MSSKMRHINAFKIFCLSVLFICGCTDLDEVAKFSSLAQSAGSSLPALVGDFKGTCLRQNELAPKSKPNLQRDCAVYDKMTPNLQQAQSVLTDYLTALGKLASDSDPGYGKTLDALGGNFKDAGLAQDQVDATTAASGLAKKITNAALEGYRRKEITKLVSESNDDVQKLTTALSDIVSKDYATMLSNEGLGIEDYYRTALNNYTQNEPLSALLVKKQWDEEIIALQNRIDAATAYGKLMKDIATSNQKIAQQKNKIGTKDLIKVIGPEVADMEQSVESLNKAFK